MSFKTTSIIAASVIASFAVTGCATVDLNDMASPVAAQDTQVEVNIVQRASQKLKSAFASKGFVAKTSRKRMQSAAKILLNGLQEKNVTAVSDADGYAAAAKPVSVVLADMAFARQHIDKTKQAAEIYLEMAPADRKLRDELTSLETALMASKEAEQVFAASLSGSQADDLAAFTRSVDALRIVTDEFGARVRVQQSQKLAMRASTI